MNEQKYNQKELLYNPKNWAFLAFLFSPILPAIFYYRNSKLLGTAQKGKKVLIGAIIFVIIFIALTFVFNYYSTLIIVAEVIIAVIIAKKLAKGQLPSYEKYRKEKGFKRDRNEIPLILIFLVIWITIGFVIPYFINKYIEDNYYVSKYRGETTYLPKKDKVKETVKEPVIEPKTVIEDPTDEPETEPVDESVPNLTSSIKGVIDLTLPDTHVLENYNQSLIKHSYTYDLQLATGSYDKDSWAVHIVPIEAVQHFDNICEPGDCMRDFLIFPNERFYLKDMEAMKKNEEPVPFTKPVDGDIGFNRIYITYYNDIRVAFTAYAETEALAEEHDEFMKNMKIVSIK
ncbi:hypothetical protein ACFL10_02195 [Patescibacteria group bacterium]